MMRTVFLALLGFLVPAEATAQLAPGWKTEEIQFPAQGNLLSGLLDTPVDGDAKALIIIVHGYGPTNVVEQNWYADIRTLFARQGIATMVWDKPGRGASEGEFDVNRPVEDSAQDVLAAAAFLRHQGTPGSHQIGFWGISRAGWIVPLAMAQDDRLSFWISVSGVDGLESFGYLLRSNWEVLGYHPARVDRLYRAWRDGNRHQATGGDYDTYIAITKELRADPFYQSMNNGSTTPSREGYLAFQQHWMATDPQFDEETGLLIYIDDFDQTLGTLEVPVLALFGEKDRSVDWQSTRALYEGSLGQNPKADLTVITFPDGNHNLHVSETGGLEEMLEILNAPEMVPGYYQALHNWLLEHVE